MPSRECYAKWLAYFKKHPEKAQLNAAWIKAAKEALEDLDFVASVSAHLKDGDIGRDGKVYAGVLFKRVAADMEYHWRIELAKNFMRCFNKHYKITEKGREAMGFAGRAPADPENLNVWSFYRIL